MCLFVPGMIGALNFPENGGVKRDNLRKEVYFKFKSSSPTKILSLVISQLQKPELPKEVISAIKS